MMWTSLNVARVRIARRAFSTAPLVSSWNEWDTLEEVVVGIADGSAIPPLHPAEEAKIFHLSNHLFSMESQLWFMIRIVLR